MTGGELCSLAHSLEPSDLHIGDFWLLYGWESGMAWPLVYWYHALVLFLCGWWLFLLSPPLGVYSKVSDTRAGFIKNPLILSQNSSDISHKEKSPNSPLYFSESEAILTDMWFWLSPASQVKRMVSFHPIRKEKAASIFWRRLICFQERRPLKVLASLTVPPADTICVACLPTKEPMWFVDTILSGGWKG